MAESGQSFEVALAVTRSGNLFTTHTAVPAGFDRFSPALIEPYFAGYVEKKLGSPSMISWLSAARTRTTPRKASTWHISPSAGAGR